jgi:hypothetical protein
VFEPFMPPIEWTAADRTTGEEQLVAWGNGLFPLKAGLKTEFRTRAHQRGNGAATPHEWKCYSGHPRKVTVEAGAYSAYPVFCRRNDGLTIQSFYAPEVNASLMTTRRKRPDAAHKRELVAFELAKGPRIAATAVHGLPKGVALAAVEQSARPPQPPTTALAAAQPPAASPQIAQPQIAQAPAPHPAPTAAAPPTTAPRPTPQPAGTPPPAAAAPTTVALAPAASPKPKAEHRPAAGGYGVQIASYRDADNVEPGWATLRQRHKPLLNGVGHVVVPVDLGSNKGIYHRLIAGPFPARAAAEELCRSIRGRGASCLVQPVSR